MTKFNCILCVHVAVRLSYLVAAVHPSCINSMYAVCGQQLFPGCSEREGPKPTISMCDSNEIVLSPVFSPGCSERVSKPVFPQVAAQVLQKNPSDLFSASRAWRVNLVGEGADDAGGVFDEIIAQICEVGTCTVCTCGKYVYIYMPPMYVCGSIHVHVYTPSIYTSYVLGLYIHLIYICLLCGRFM